MQVSLCVIFVSNGTKTVPVLQMVQQLYIYFGHLGILHTFFFFFFLSFDLHGPFEFATAIIISA